MTPTNFKLSMVFVAMGFSSACSDVLTSGPETFEFVVTEEGRQQNSFSYLDHQTGTLYNFVSGLDSNDIRAFGLALDNVNACDLGSYGCDLSMIKYDQQLINDMTKG